MMKRVGDAHKKSNSRNKKDKGKEGEANSIDFFCVEKGEEEPYSRHKGESHILDLVPEDHAL